MHDEGYHAARVGFHRTPDEKEAVYEKALQDIPRLTHLAPPTGAYPISFARFSRYFENPAAYHLDLKPQDFYRLIYPFDAPSVANLAYHFVDQNADTTHVDAWLDRLNAAILRWTQRWLGEDSFPQARLCLATDGVDWAVYDSRSGQEIETPVNPTDKHMLDRLDTPCSISQFASEFGAHAPTRLAFFRERGWLFEDVGQCMSLVS